MSFRRINVLYIYDNSTVILTGFRWIISIACKKITVQCTHRARPIIAKRIRWARKVLYTIFFNYNDSIVHIRCKEGRTITVKFHKDNVIKAQVRVWKAYSLLRTMLLPTKV